MTLEVTKRIYSPSLTVGQVYAKRYGTNDLPLPVGNVLAMAIDQTEDVQDHADMTRLGGGQYAQVRRVKEVKLTMQLADINVANLARATQATASEVQTGTITNKPFTAKLGALLPAGHIGLSAVVLKVGADAGTATVVPMAGNYEVRASGVYLLPTATGVEDDDSLWLSCTYAAYASLEAITTSAAELELTFEGMNEANDGSPVVVNIWRASQGVSKSLALISGKLGVLDVEGTLLADTTKTGAGISRFYNVLMA